MSNAWITSDHHFHHHNILSFRNDEGNLIRPGFTDVHHMNEHMIERWNSVVKTHDKVYHLGDIVMKTGAWAFEEIIPRLNGTIVLIKGNHDRAKINTYAHYFKDVRSEVHMKTSEGDMVVFTHRPIRIGPGLEEHLESRILFNVHGHIHGHIIEDPHYINVCVEVTDYTPVSWNEMHSRLLELRKRIRKGSTADEN